MYNVRPSSKSKGHFQRKEGKPVVKLIKKMNYAEEIILVTMFALMVVVIFVQVIMRYVFHSSLTWSEELGKFLFVWISWLGISIGEKRGEHIKITMLTDKLNVKWQHIFNLISESIVIAICAVTVYYSAIMALQSTTIHYAGIHISVFWGYLAVVVGCAVMILRALGTCMLSVKGLCTGKPLSSLIEKRNARDVIETVIACEDVEKRG